MDEAAASVLRTPAPRQSASRGPPVWTTGCWRPPPPRVSPPTPALPGVRGNDLLLSGLDWSVNCVVSRRFGPHKLLSPNTLAVETGSGPEEEPSKTNRITSPLSPIRGISYPPLSPKSLKRGFAIQQGPGRNPPLFKTRSHVDPPNITVIPDSQQEKPTGEGEQQDLHHKRGRHDKERSGQDTRRYYTAGTIEDLKVRPT